jgi:hypothetical protein
MKKQKSDCPLCQQMFELIHEPYKRIFGIEIDDPRWDQFYSLLSSERINERLSEMSTLHQKQLDSNLH